MMNIIKYVFWYGVLVVIMQAIISGIAVLSGGLMSILGFEYSSIFSLILYFAIVALVGLPLDIFTQAVPKALLAIKKIEKKTARILFVIMDTFATYFVMMFVDNIMESVSATKLSIIVIAFVFAVFSIDKEKM